MDGEKDKKFDDLRFRLNDLSEELKRLRDQWVNAHGNKDISRETELAHREEDLFNEFGDVIKGFEGWMKQSRAA